MKRILIYGLKEPIGGVENVVLSYTSQFPKEEIVCDYLMYGTSFSKEEEIRKHGGTVFYLPNRLKQHKAYQAAIRHIFEENRYDAVWANVAGLTNIDVLTLGKQYGVPIRIVHSHGTRLYWTGRLMQYLVPLLHARNKRKIHRVATHFWACSQAAGTFMFPPCTHDRLTVIRNAVDTEIFLPNGVVRQRVRRQWQLEDKAPVVVHIARMSAEKNQAFLLRVFADLLQKRPDARLLLVGDGELRAELEAYAAELGIAEAVLFTGFRSDVADLLRAGDVFVLPSTSEGLGLCLIEAQACGIPCVASTDVPAEADITETVRFVPLSEPVSVWSDAVLDAMQTQISDPTAAVENAHYSLKQEADKLARFFVGKESL